ncbi:transcriptional regulator [Pseudomonas oryzihabitans]|uniref:transcriptional regulator n=1 Tax=Pseudomonas oryzihabitans TaxID=47885 RepID=UPI0011A6FDB3|nr:Cro/CI family transcriptional regulator [Pseudomonas psychrotolerans]
MVIHVKRLIDFFGGQSRTAAAMGVTQSAVSQWASGAIGMSASRALLAQQLTGGEVLATELCPALAKAAQLKPMEKFCSEHSGLTSGPDGSVRASSAKAGVAMTSPP